MERVASGAWSCVDCDYLRMNRGDVANHVESKHIEFAGVACDYCGHYTKTRKALKMHMFRAHKDKRILKAETIEITYNNEGN